MLLLFSLFFMGTKLQLLLHSLPLMNSSLEEVALVSQLFYKSRISFFPIKQKVIFEINQ